MPDLWQAEDAGDRYYIKLWQRRSEESIALRAMWNREVRSLMRLQGYPGAAELFMRLRDLEVTETHYYAVLDGGRRMLLSDVLQNRGRHPWLLNLGEIGRRRPLWEGLLRLAEALSILHGEGTLHRSLLPESVFVGPDGQADFRLSGFEWSLRLVGLEGAAVQVVRGTSPLAPELDEDSGEYSTGTDWFDFGLVVAELFGAPIRASKNRDIARASVERLSTLRVKEKEFILQLLAEDEEQRLSSSDGITHEIRNIIRELSVATSGAGRDLVIAVRLSPELDLQRTIEAASLSSAPAHDIIKQRDWMKFDLRGDVRIIARTSPYPHFVLKGEKLEYRVRQWDADGLSTWDIGFCEGIEPLPRVTPDDQYFSLGQRKLDIQLYPHVRRNYRSVRDRSAQWDKVYPFRKEKVRLPAHLRDVHDFFRVTQQLDTVLTVAQVCPVVVTNISYTTSDTIVDVTPFDEPERTELARYLGFGSPAEQLKDWFDLGAETISADDEDDPKRDRYSFLDRKTIGSESSSAVWRFVSAKPERSGPKYRFRAQGTARLKEGRLYLARNHGGTLAQIRRRHKAIEDLRSHEGLLRVIAAPRDASHRSTDTLPAGTANIPLDASKLAALEALWKTQPSFAIQGPPGTGKTTLIQAFADRLFTADRSSQILVTAHSHHTVDDVRKKLAKLFVAESGSDRPILVRLGANEETEHDLGPVTGALIRALNESELAASAPEYLRLRISAAATGASDGAEVEVGTMQRLVQDAANLTFSTSNSAELADLATRGRRFDWSIIEEAAKAHGFDMAVALQESHRILLIGDHHQLPPFNVRTFKDLLGDPLKVRKAIQTGAPFAPGLIDPSIADEDEGRSPLEERCALWRRMVTLFAELFENSVQADGRLGPAATLTDQHRMHPHIADLVGNVFYPDEFGGTILTSPKETHDKFLNPAPFIIPNDSWLPQARIVWCDVPWVQKEHFAEGETDGLFLSSVEANLVPRVLRELRPRGQDPCEIQILSPYNDQLRAIRGAVEKAQKGGLLTNMFKDPFDLHLGTRMGATVDEFQGSEADVVVVSLVRNNALVPWKSVGFLKESNRMNVLLSRARHKLIIIGSWDFFDTRYNEFTTADDEYSYINDMMQQFKKALTAGTLAKVKYKP
ncbi:serine/threonine protein kinase/DNA polymerase III delta prime subunit [Bradyrhizobium sp. RT6a]|uniref:AAA domain-containing protein n=1 Tax=Bradyrhizobium sp. RT6a TaxID=3156381 RepID=UPI00339983A5